MSEVKPQQEPSMEEILASIRRIISTDGRDERDREERAEDGGVEDDEVLELTEEVAADPEGLAAPDPAARTMMQPEPEPGRDSDSEAHAFPASIDDEPTPRSRVAELDQTLISRGAARASEQSLATLAAAVGRRRQNPALGMSERTLEDLVKEVMRPMIKEWMDANLPDLVERLVEREIDRLSRRAEDGI